MNEREALKLALEALEKFRYHIANNYEINAAIVAAREALAQPEQEQSGFFSREAMKAHSDFHVAQPEQEPVAWLIDNDYTTVFFEIADVHRSKGKKVEPLYTTPPQRTWVGLTDEEEFELYQIYGDDLNLFLDQRDMKLKQKNGYAEQKNT